MAIERNGITRELGETMLFTGGNENTPKVEITLSNRYGRPVGFILRISQDGNVVDLSLPTLLSIAQWADKGFSYWTKPIR